MTKPNKTKPTGLEVGDESTLTFIRQPVQFLFGHNYFYSMDDLPENIRRHFQIEDK